MMYAGLRCGEACATEPADIKGSVLRVFRAVSYDGSVIPAKTVGHVIIPRWLAERVENSEHKKLTPGMVRESFRRYGKKTGIHLNPHMLRHWYATMLVRGKVNPEIARRQMRHSDLKTTLEYYAQVAVSDIEDAINETFS
jgi:integrase